MASRSDASPSDEHIAGGSGADVHFDDGHLVPLLVLLAPRIFDQYHDSS